MENIEKTAKDFITKNPRNTISEEIALEPETVGLQIYDDPGFAYGSAEDKVFSEIKNPEVVGSHHLMPRDWLPQAKTVISVFLPFSEQVREANRRDYRLPASHWFHARIQGQELLSALMIYLCDWVKARGYDCVVPSEDKRFRTGGHDKKNDFTSNWSERHVAYTCGHGTFGLSAGLITKKGVAGRFGSLVTNMEFPVTEKDYTGSFDYCSKCGICAEHCPAEAISFENGKDHKKCSDFLDATRKSPYYGCGKCQVGVPCETKPACIPTEYKK